MRNKYYFGQNYILTVFATFITFSWLIAPLSAEEGFVSLFDGKTFDGWKHNGNWVIEGDTFYRKEKGGSLVYTAAKVPDDFELRFDWKVSKACNSGVYYRPGQVEYQILDDVNSPYGENPRQSAATLSD